MNHIAHCLLSYNDDDLLLGNFIGDYVKGQHWRTYPEGVQRGILLHRAIDAFTDSHPATRQSVQRIRAHAGRYSPPVVDILYDHLLCREWDQCSRHPFESFAGWVYQSLDRSAGAFPPELGRRWPAMLNGRFLHGYKEPPGLTWVLRQFNLRLGGILQTDQLIPFFFEEIDQFAADFNGFFPDLANFVRTERSLH